MSAEVAEYYGRLMFEAARLENGEGALLGANCKPTACGCRIIGCGTQALPLEIKYCEVHDLMPILSETNPKAIKEARVIAEENSRV